MVFYVWLLYASHTSWESFASTATVLIQYLSTMQRTIPNGVVHVWLLKYNITKLGKRLISLRHHYNTYNLVLLGKPPWH